MHHATTAHQHSFPTLQVYKRGMLHLARLRLQPRAILHEERDAIIEYRKSLQREGRSVICRIQTYEMLDSDVVACSE